LRELADHDCLTASSGLASRTLWTLEGPRGREEVKVAGRLTANSARALIKSCVSGFGIALLPTMLIRAELRSGDLLRVLPEYKRAGADLNVLLPSEQRIPSAVSTFIDFVTDKFQVMACDPG